MKPVKLGLLGVGTVGASTAMVLKDNAAEIARRAGRSIEIIQASRRSLAAGMPAGCDNIALVGAIPSKSSIIPRSISSSS